MIEGKFDVTDYNTMEEEENKNYSGRTNETHSGVLRDYIDKRKKCQADEDLAHKDQFSTTQMLITSKTNEELSVDAAAVNNTDNVDIEETESTDALSHHVNTSTNKMTNVETSEAKHTASEEKTDNEMPTRRLVKKKEALKIFQNFSAYFKTIFQTIWEQKKYESNMKVF